MHVGDYLLIQGRPNEWGLLYAEFDDSVPDPSPGLVESIDTVHERLPLDEARVAVGELVLGAAASA